MEKVLHRLEYGHGKMSDIDLLVDVEQHLEEDIDHTRLYLLLDRLWELEEPERCHIGTEHFKEFVLLLAVDVGIVTVILMQVPFVLFWDAVPLILFEFYVELKVILSLFYVV